MTKSRLLAFSLIVVLTACTSNSVTPSSTTGNGSIPSGSTTTTVPERCPDVFCILYTIRADATWSDGAPVVAADFAHTLGVFQNSAFPDPDNPGYELVTGLEVIDESTFMLAMSEVFGAWRTLFDVVFPAHADYDPINPGPTSGVFTLELWDDEDGIVLRRRASYTGPNAGGEVEEIRFALAGGARAMVEGLRVGEYNLISPVPQDWVLDELSASTGLDYALDPGAFWEQISFNHDDPLLSQHWVREAIASAINRESILDATVRQLSSDASTLGNTMWMASSPNYQNHFTGDHSPSRAEQIMAANGCQRGSDGVQVCDGRRMSFLWATTTGDPYRQTQVERATGMLAGVGIEILTWTLAPADLFATPIFFGGPSVWQLMSFAWKAPSDPFLAESMYMCVGDGPHGMGLLNMARYCNPEVEDLVVAARGVLDPAERAAEYNRADRAYLEDLAVIPLYQRPALLAWTSSLSGPEINPWSTDLWNVGAWTGRETVVVALSALPRSLNAPLPTDDGAAMIMDALYSGAFEVTPSMEFVPALISDTELIVRGSG